MQAAQGAALHVRGERRDPQRIAPPFILSWDRLTAEVSLGDWSVNGRPEPSTCLPLRYPGGRVKPWVDLLAVPTSLAVGCCGFERHAALSARAHDAGRKGETILSYSGCTVATIPLSRSPSLVPMPVSL